ncbi:MAG TPA: anti-sigma factor [Pyrinomonadaceae bacterium]|nr:anti-sigma factor [Pyrinomonadaceae bacterium]
MKCEVCVERLEEYLDGELPAGEQEQISAHLITCADCSASFSALTAEQELFARYERDVEVPPFLWTRIAQHTVAANNGKRAGWRGYLFATPLASVIAILVIAAAVGIVYWMSSRPTPKESVKQTDPTLPRNGTDLVQESAKGKQQRAEGNGAQPKLKPEQIIATHQQRRVRQTTKHTPRIDQSDVLSSDLGYLDMDDQDTAKHIEQTQNLLRSIRNVSVTDGDEEIDVSYDKALSRRLLNENIVLRRDAEMKAKFPTKTLLADVEPFLIDIANLPDRARPEDVRVIKERVQKTEIVAALMGYQDRGPNNR